MLAPIHAQYVDLIGTMSAKHFDEAQFFSKRMLFVRTGDTDLFKVSPRLDCLELRAGAEQEPTRILILSTHMLLSFPATLTSGPEIMELDPFQVLFLTPNNRASG